MTKEKSAGAVIFRKEGNKIYYLLLHYELGHWDFAKGHIEKGESEIEALLREIEEETGIKDVRLVKGFKKKISYSYKLKNKDIFKTVVFYLAKTQSKKVKLSFEHIGFKWLLFKQAYEKATFDNAKNILKKANNYIY